MPPVVGDGCDLQNAGDKRGQQLVGASVMSRWTITDDHRKMATVMLCIV